MGKSKTDRDAGSAKAPFSAVIERNTSLRTAGDTHRLEAGERITVVHEKGESGMVSIDRSGQNGFVDKTAYRALPAGAVGRAAGVRPTAPFDATTNPPSATLHTSDGPVELTSGTRIHVSREENGHGLVSVPGRPLAGFMDMSEYTPDP